MRSSAPILLLFACVSACAGHLAGDVFHKRGVTYRLGALPPGFQRVSVEDYDLAYYKPGAGTIGVNAMCTDYDDVPPDALLNHLLFGTNHRTFLRDEEVTVDGRAARHALVTAELDGVPVQLDVYLLTRGGCVFDLSYVSPLEAPARSAFDRFVAAFRIESVSRD